MKTYHLLSGELNPIDYVLIAGLIAVTVVIAVIVIWRKAKGKGGCDCGGCPSAKSGGCSGGCTSCTSCPSKK